MALFRAMNCPTLETSLKSGDNPAEDSLLTTSLKIIHYFYGDEHYREYLRESSPTIPFEALNSEERIKNYMDDIIKSGTTCLRRKRIFTVGHQGSGKSSLLHSMR